METDVTVPAQICTLSKFSIFIMGNTSPFHRVRILSLTPPTKRVLGVTLPNSPTREAVRFARYLCQKFPYPAP